MRFPLRGAIIKTVMGYSQTVRSSVAYHMALAFAYAAGHVASDTPSNGWHVKGTDYYEDRGNEQRDGAYTATVYRIGEKVEGREGQAVSHWAHKVGSIRIDADGQIRRWAGMPASVVREVNAEMRRRPTLGTAASYEYQDAAQRARSEAKCA